MQHQNIIDKKGHNYLHILFKKYIKEVLEQYQKKHGQIPKQTTPIPADVEPEWMSCLY